MHLRHRYCALISLIVIGICCKAQATIGRSAFSANATVEGFEGIVSTGNNLAIQTPFIFPSGVALTGPSPSIEGSFGPFVVTGGFFGIGGGADIPDGVAYLGQSNPNDLTGPLVFTFPTPVLRAGAFASTTDPPNNPHATVIMEALDSHGNVLESATISSVSPSQWASNFVGIQNSAMISQLEFIGDRTGVLRIDDLTFEVPEPSSLAILASGLFLISRRRL
jgi:hypothetical protein